MCQSFGTDNRAFAYDDFVVGTAVKEGANEADEEDDASVGESVTIVGLLVSGAVNNGS